MGANWYPKQLDSRQRIESSGGGMDVDRSFIGHYAAAPALADPNGILAAQATSASVITTVLAAAMLAQPDVPRVVEVLPGGTTADVPTGNVTILGTDIEDTVITEDLAFTANDTVKQTSVKAYKTITSIIFPVQDGAAATYDFGWGLAIGMPFYMDDDALVLAALFDGTDELASATVTVHASLIANNLYAADGTLDGAKFLDIYYIAT